MGSDTAPLIVGIVLYNNRIEELARLRLSLEQTRLVPGTPEFAVQWFDNSCSDEYRRGLVDVGITSVSFTDQNLGFGRAHNRLMASAFAGPNTRWYLCLNPDALVHPEMLVELLAQADRLKRPGLVEALQFPREHPKFYDPVTHATAWCSGCALLVSRELYHSVGGFDDDIFLYCEDVDLSWRARAAGFDIAVAPRALVHHYTGDRPPGGRTRIEMVRAGAHLAAKWGDEAFGRRCREEYKELTGEELPPPSVRNSMAHAAGVADFTHSFHFAEPRW